ncbi:hypothetical protein D3C86_1378730 [compost metagenome]
MQTEGEVVVRADPLGGVDGAGLQGGEDLAGRQIDHGAAHLGQHLAAEARGAHLQALEVVDAVDFLVEPAGGLHAGGAAGEGHHVERLVHLFPQLHAAAVVQPGVHFLGVGAERQGAEELRGRHLALPVVGRAVAHLGGAARHRVEHLQRRHQFAGRIDLDLQAAVAHFVDQAGEALGANAHPGKVLRPGGDHLPGEGFGGSGRLGFLAFVLLLATGQCGGGQTDTGSGENVTTFHAGLLVVLLALPAVAASLALGYHSLSF